MGSCGARLDTLQSTVLPCALVVLLPASHEASRSGQQPFCGSPPAPFTKLEKCMPLAFREGSLNPDSLHGSPGPRNHGVGGYESPTSWQAVVQIK